MKQIIYLISMKEILFIAILAIAAALPAAAQHDLSYAAEDARQRGYYDRPYLRYEAEEGACDGQLKFLNKPGRYRCSLIQTELPIAVRRAWSKPAIMLSGRPMPTPTP